MIADIDLFYLKFFNDDDRQTVIDHGPLFLAGRISVIRSWTPAVEQYINKIKAMLTGRNAQVTLGVQEQSLSDKGLEMISEEVQGPLTTILSSELVLNAGIYMNIKMLLMGEETENTTIEQVTLPVAVTSVHASPEILPQEII
ncbi:hypothetical protein IFM89_003615 [Coptis chinensis]|uniref:Uncharacterized protein n=1 Tax=Coptis chinensis TaxID=261450 RepID=A0A835H4A5_9MAGN|nr:hypothetical protein IFM89_003615 [Coptis chinensis]